MITVLNSILAFTIVLGIIVLVHEFGHYIAARLVGVKVLTFSFGFGKKLLGKKIGDTDFRISIIPLGGYVKMAGEDEYDPENLKPYEFQAKNRAQKIFILFMGPAMNVLLSLLILTVINLNGVEQEKYKYDPPVIGFVEGGSNAEKAGLQKGDLITRINDEMITNWRDFELFIGANPNEELDVEYRRQGRLYVTKLKVSSITEYNLGFVEIYWKQKPLIKNLYKDYPANKAGMEKGDLITAIENKKISNYFEMQNKISASSGKPLRFTVKRGKEILDIDITPIKFDERWIIGIIPDIPTIKIHYGFIESVKKSADELVRLTSLTFTAFKKMIVGKLSPKNLSGPIEIAKFSQRAMESGGTNFFMLIAFISIQLGIVNLFPIPALDGGHLMIYSIEAVIRKEFSQRVKAILINSGFILLITLMVFVILNDIAKALPNGWRSLLPF